MEKCFCHLNGYKVKDSDARKSIEETQNILSELVTNFDEFKTSNNETFEEFKNSCSETIEALNLSMENVERNVSNFSAITRNINFNAISSIYNQNNDFDLMVIDNFENTDGIDTTKDDGNYVVVNNYDNINCKISVPSGTIKMFRSVAVDTDFSISKFFISLDAEGDGSVDVFLSTDGGLTFNKVEQNVLQDCVQGNSVVVQLQLNGEISLYNIGWGVKA